MTTPNGKRNHKPGYLEDDQGNPHAMRLGSVTALIASIIFGLLAILHPMASNGDNGLFITIAFLAAAFVPKALQKFAEAKLP